MDPSRIINSTIKKTPPSYNFEFCAKKCSHPRFPTVETSIFGDNRGPNMGKTFHSVHIKWAEMRGMAWHAMMGMHGHGHDMACDDGDTWAWAWSEGPRKGLRRRAPLFPWSQSSQTTRPRACHACSLAGGGGAAGAGPCFRFRIRKRSLKLPLASRRPRHLQVHRARGEGALATRPRGEANGSGLGG